jgi:hypothetical protein
LCIFLPGTSPFSSTFQNSKSLFKITTKEIEIKQ